MAENAEKAREALASNELSRSEMLSNSMQGSVRESVYPSNATYGQLRQVENSLKFYQATTEQIQNKTKKEDLGKLMQDLKFDNLELDQGIMTERIPKLGNSPFAVDNDVDRKMFDDEFWLDSKIDA